MAATTTIFQNISNWFGKVSEVFETDKFNMQRDNQPNAYKEIEFIANYYKTNYGCEVSNDWLNSMASDRHAARLMLTQKHRYSVPIYNPDLEPLNPDEYIKRSELTKFMRDQEFKNFIGNLKCSCPKH